MTIRNKMILILLACTIIPMFFVGMLGFYHARKTLESLRMEQLQSIADLKVQRIEDFYADQKRHIMIAQQRPTLKKYATMQLFRATFPVWIMNPSETNWIKHLKYTNRFMAL
jgi:hypothetical protein